MWSYDFMGGRTRDGSPLRILNVVDKYTRLALGSHVDRSIGVRDVQAQLEQLFAPRQASDEYSRLRSRDGYAREFGWCRDEYRMDGQFLPILTTE